MADRYAVEYVNNESMASFHFTKELPRISHWASDKNTPEGDSLRSHLMAIDGVVEVSSHQQRVTVTRGGAYTWEEIEPLVVAVVQEFTGVEQFERVSLYAAADN